MHTLITCLTASALLLLTACSGGSSSTPSTTGDNTGNPDGIPVGGGGDTGNSSGTVLFYGFIGVSDNASGDSVDLNGGFVQLSNSVTATAFQQGIGPVNDAPDTCEFTVSESVLPDVDSGDIDINIPNVFPTLVSAGEIIPFTSTSGSFADLERTITPIVNFTVYVLAGDPTPQNVPGPVPTGLTFDITGDVFPAFADVPVPNIDSLVLISPARGAVVTGDTTFTWEATPGSEAVISIKASGVQFDIENPTSFGFTSLSCEVVDDGSFTIPAATQAEIAAAGGNLTFSQMTRTLSSLEQNGNAVLIVTRTSDF